MKMKILSKLFILGILFLMLVFLHNNKNLIAQENLNSLISPEIKQDGIYFRYFNNTAKKVYLKSSFDDWSYRYAFYKKSDGIWELKLPNKDPLYQLEKGQYHYRFIIDGINIYDKLNPEREKDQFGVPYSILNVPYDLYDYSHSPIKLENNIYRFFTFSNKSKTLEIVGSFNNFVPEEMIQDKFRDKLYYKDISLPSGTYYYCFIIDGKWEIDYRNDSIVVDSTRRKLSKTIIK